MKLIIAILSDTDSHPVSTALVSTGFRVTSVASTGGFLRRGSSTLMIGVEDTKVEEAIQIIRDRVSPTPDESSGHATLFVLNIENFTQV
jgi:uncharacterized protein YaaQ